MFYVIINASSVVLYLIQNKNAIIETCECECKN